MPPKKIEYVGVAEIAQIANVGSSAVSNWRRRFSYLKAGDPFPKPVATPKSGPVFDKAAVIEWLKRNEKYPSGVDLLAKDV